MPFQPDGSFNREINGGWQADRDANIKITAVRHDLEDDGFAKGLGDTITRYGTSTIMADIPFNGKKITGYASISTGDAADTVVNKGYVDSFKSFTTGLVINGAGPINGFLNFTSPTGVNGIGWATADMSWIGRIGVINESAKRLAVNDKPDGTGADVFTVDETGRINSPTGIYGQNLDYESSAYRTTVAGFGTLLTVAAGAIAASINDVATTVAHQVATLRQFFSVYNSNGDVTLALTKSASGKLVGIRGYMTDKLRWLMYLGDQTAETGSDRVGSNFDIYSYNNAGSTAFLEMSINRLTHAWTTGGAISINGQITFDNYLVSSTTTALLTTTGSGTCYLRPGGLGVTTGQLSLSTSATNIGADTNMTGHLTISGTSNGITAGYGLKAKAGATGTQGANWVNFYYANPYLYAYVDNAQLGAIMWQSDYRMKKDIRPLPGMWDKVKALHPISYSIKDWLVFTNDDTPRWGFVAHELQEQLLESAATGRKDEENVVQNPNPWTVIAALTKALQEAMLRIEALEAGS